MHFQVQDAERDELRRMLNSRPWQWVRIAVEADANTHARAVLSGALPDAEYIRRSARYNALQDFLKAVYSAAGLTIQ